MMKPKISNGGLSTACTIIAGIITIVGGICAQREQLERLEEIDREYHEDKDTEATEEEV